MKLALPHQMRITELAAMAARQGYRLTSDRRGGLMLKPAKQSVRQHYWRKK